MIAAASSVTAEAWELNYTIAQFAGLKRAYNAVKAGTGKGLAIFIGESGLQGESAGDTDGTLNRKNASMYRATTVLANAFTASGARANTTSFFGSGGLFNSVVIANWRAGAVQLMPGIDFAAPWAVDALTTAGGCGFTASAAAQATFNFGTFVDTFRIWTIQASGAGVMDVSVDGGVKTRIIETNATPSYTPVVVSAGSLAQHTLAIDWVSGTAFVAGVEAFDSNVKEFTFRNAGVGSAKIADLMIATAPYGRLLALLTLATGADLAHIEFGINDMLANTSEANFKGTVGNTTLGYNGLITRLKAVMAADGTIVLVIPQASRTTSIPLATQQAFRQYIRDVAIANGLPCLDQSVLFPDWDTMNANGDVFNANHKNKQGHAKFGAALATSYRKWAQVT